MPKLTLNENHEYYSGRERVPGVTEIIGSCFPFTGKGVHVDRARNFGECAHKSVELHAKDNLDFSTVDPALLPYIRQFDIVCEHFGINKKRSVLETMLFSKKYKFAGKIDCVDNAVYDWKTGQRSKNHRLQIAAYRHLWNINNPRDKKSEGIIIYLDGTDNILFEEEQPQDFGVFLSVMEVYKFKKN
jgi:hypothetical protein